MFCFLSGSYFPALAFLGNALEYFWSGSSMKNRLCFYALKRHAEKPTACHIGCLILEETAGSISVTHGPSPPPASFEKCLGSVSSQVSPELLDPRAGLFGNTSEFRYVAGETPSGCSIPCPCRFLCHPLTRCGGASGVPPPYAKRDDTAL